MNLTNRKLGLQWHEEVARRIDQPVEDVGVATPDLPLAKDTAAMSGSMNSAEVRQRMAQNSRTANVTTHRHCR